MTAKLIIEQNITTLKQTAQKDDSVSLCLIHETIGKVLMAVELGALEWIDAEPYINTLLKMNSDIKP